MKHLYNKHSLKSLLVSAVLCGTGIAAANATDLLIPASESEFETMWFQQSGDTGDVWSFVNSAEPYAAITPVADGQTGTTLVYATPISMREGDVWYMQGLVCSADYNDDEFFYITVGTDPANMTPIKQSTSFKTWGVRNQTVPTFSAKPADSSTDRVFTAPVDGNYYIGIRSWKASGSFTSKQLLCRGLRIEKSVNYPQKVTSTSATADPDGALSVTLTWTWPSKNKDGDAIAGKLGANIYRSDSNSKDAIYRPQNIIATLTNGVAGEKGTYTDSEENNAPIPASGKWYYYIAPFNEEGENSECQSNQIVEAKWVGEDVKALNPLNATAAADGDGVKVRFKNRYEGYNGGWLNPALLKNRITRIKENGEPVVVYDGEMIAADADGLSTFVDTNLDGFATYKYSVYIVYNDEPSSSVTTTAIKAGGSATLPWSEDFSSSSSLTDNFSSVGTGSYKWTRTYGADNAATFKPYSSATSTLVTLPFKLAAGKTYRVVCESWVDEDEDDDDWGYGWGTSTYPVERDLILVAGSSVDDAAMTQFAKHHVDVAQSDKKQYEAYFSPAANGIYYFGFRATADNMGAIYLDNLLIEESVSTPAAVSDLTVTPDAKGANEATIAFTIPSTTNGGTPLASVDSYTIVCNETEAELLVEGPFAAGEQISKDYSVDAAGAYSFTVTVAEGDSESDAVTSTPVWVGYDTPKKLSAYDIHCDLNAEGTPVLTWVPLEGEKISVNGGYIDVENLKYRIYRIDLFAEDQTPLLIAEETGAEYADAEIHDIEWGKYRYGITAVNGENEGVLSEVFNAIVGGTVQEMPFAPDMTDYDYVSEWDGSQYTVESTGLVWKDKEETAEKELWVYLPPFRTSETDTKNCAITLTASRGNEEFDESFEVWYCNLNNPTVDETETETPAEAPRRARVILGENNKTMVSQHTVTAAPDAPQAFESTFTLPSAGRYRVALRCTSEINSRLNIHSVKVSNNLETGVSATVDNNAEAVYYTLQGVRVSNPGAGVYIRLRGGVADKVVRK